MSDKILLAKRGTGCFFYFVTPLLITGVFLLSIFGISVLVILWNHCGKLDSKYLFVLSTFALKATRTR